MQRLLGGGVARVISVVEPEHSQREDRESEDDSWHQSGGSYSGGCFYRVYQESGDSSHSDEFYICYLTSPSYNQYRHVSIILLWLVLSCKYCLIIISIVMQVWYYYYTQYCHVSIILSESILSVKYYLIMISIAM